MNGDNKMKDEREFDSWRHYSASAASDHFPSVPYYAPVFPYQSESAWSNGQEVPFLSQYDQSQQQQGHYAMEAMFGSQNNYFGTSMSSSMANPINSFNAFFPSNSDPFWSSSKSRSAVGHYARPQMADEYNYHHSDYMPDVKHVETGIAGLTLDHIKASEASAVGFGDQKKFEVGSAVGQAPKKTTWASIASQPAKPQPKSLKSKMSSSALTGAQSKHLPPQAMETIGTWEAKNGQAPKTPPQTLAPPPPQPPQRQPLAPPTHTQAPPPAAAALATPPHWSREAGLRARQEAKSEGSERSAGGGGAGPGPGPHPVLEKLRVENNYNPKEFELNPRSARFFIIKSYSEDDIHRSIKYSIWCSTEHGNKRLDAAFKQQHDKGPLYLLFSVNGSGHFCGMAQMMSSVDYSASASVWAQDKWKGQFRVKWIYVKDVPNAQLRHIRLENNENKPVTNSRDTQEVPPDKGKQVIKIMHHYRHTTSIFDDFLHYEKRQEEESQRRHEPEPQPQPRRERPPKERGGQGQGQGGQWRQ